MTDLEIMQILIKAKELGITDDDVMKMRGAAVSRETFVPDLKPEEIVKPLSAFDDLSDEEILYYATPYYDEIQGKKEAQKQKLSEETNNGSR